MAVYEVVLEGKLDEGDALTVLHYDVTGDPDFESLADEILTRMNDDLIDWVVGSLVYSGITVREDIPGGVGTFYAFSPAPVTGSAVAPDFIAQTALIVRKLTATGVRPSKGRIYQAGVPSAAANDVGLYELDFSQGVQTFWESMRIISFDDSATATMVVKASNPTAPNTVPYNPVSSVQALGNPGTQRRRRLGTGS